MEEKESSGLEVDEVVPCQNNEESRLRGDDQGEGCCGRLSVDSTEHKQLDAPNVGI